jgi:hypothetical protein
MTCCTHPHNQGDRPTVQYAIAAQSYALYSYNIRAELILRYLWPVSAVLQVLATVQGQSYSIIGLHNPIHVICCVLGHR